MAINELQFQTEIVKAARREGGHSFKLSNRFTSGIPDLYIKIPSLPSIFIECKWAKIKDTTRIIPIKLTMPQIKFIMDEREAGGLATVLIGGKLNNVFYIYPLKDVSSKKILMEDFINKSFKRKYGEKWKIKKIIKSMI